MPETDTANNARADKCKILRDSLIEHAAGEAKQLGLEPALASVALAEASLLAIRRNTHDDLAFVLAVDALCKMVKGMAVNIVLKREEN